MLPVQAHRGVNTGAAVALTTETMDDEREIPCFDLAVQNVKFGAGFGLVYGAILEGFKNPPQPRPTDKVVLKPQTSNVMGKAITTMARQTMMMGAVATVYSAGECGAEFVRGKDDVLNTAFGGCLAGGAIGMKTGKISHMCAGCFGAAIIVSAIRLGTNENDKAMNRERVDKKRSGKREKLLSSA